MNDGRLVLSDFGLATDSFDGTTSIHGGTVAYMAPEVVRGGAPAWRRDIWALGAVIHEVVFGERLQWNTAGGRDAQLRRRAAAVADRAERARDLPRLPVRRSRPAGRASAAEIAARLSDAGLARSAGRRWRRRARGWRPPWRVIAVRPSSGAKRIEASRKRPTLGGRRNGRPTRS